MTRKWAKSLILTVGASESIAKDGVTDDLAVGLKIANDEPALYLSSEILVEAKTEKNGVAVQGVEDSTPRPQEKEEMPAEGAAIVLLCVSGY